MADAPSGPARPGTAANSAEAPAQAPASLALYRKYRPATFAEVKGQDQVTEPLRQALRSGRIHHAYLFSGPRGCGKTSSARILARSLNCVHGPTPDPCGECDSCVALAPTGPGSIDVIEIDAASHGGVDDARDLRERAFYAPVSGRYKIYIIDEAHMVTQQGFNALLKLVEEPPAHLKFIFATTEPEKVISTIRSRTHHYPFRLVPPAVLRGLLEDILGREGVGFDPAVLPLVVRAGAGSVRDSLSVLDQLVAGSGESGLGYERAIALLGYTDETLLDEIVGAFAGADGAGVFGVVNRVIEGGHEPRRFAADMLDRFRDLIILASVPDAGQTGLLDAPPDRLERMSEQAARFGLAGLTRAAEIISTGLDQMRGATSPRLLLELMCAQVLLPSASNDEKALLARLERLERRSGAGFAEPADSAAPAVSPARAEPSADSAEDPGTRSAERPAGTHGANAGTAGGRAAAESATDGDEREARTAARRPRGSSGQRREDAAPGTGPEDVPAGPADERPAAGPPAGPGPAQDLPDKAREAAAGSGHRAGDAARGDGARAAHGTADIVSFLRQWDAVLDAVKRERRVTWMLLSNATVVSLDEGVLTLRFARDGDVRGFTGSGCDADLARVLEASFGLHLRIRAVSGAGGTGTGAGDRAAAGRGASPASPGPGLRSVGESRTSGTSAEVTGSWGERTARHRGAAHGRNATPRAGTADDSPDPADDSWAAADESWPAADDESREPAEGDTAPERATGHSAASDPWAGAPAAAGLSGHDPSGHGPSRHGTSGGGPSAGGSADDGPPTDGHLAGRPPATGGTAGGPSAGGATTDAPPGRRSSAGGGPGGHRAVGENAGGGASVGDSAGTGSTTVGGARAGNRGGQASAGDAGGEASVGDAGGRASGGDAGGQASAGDAGGGRTRAGNATGRASARNAGGHTGPGDADDDPEASRFADHGGGRQEAAAAGSARDHGRRGANARRGAAHDEDISDPDDMAVPGQAAFTGVDLIQRELGGEIIDEIDDDTV